MTEALNVRDLSALLEAAREVLKDLETDPIVDRYDKILSKLWVKQGKAIVKASKPYADMWDAGIEETAAKRKTGALTWLIETIPNRAWSRIMSEGEDAINDSMLEATGRAQGLSFMVGSEQIQTSINAQVINFNLAHPSAISYLDNNAASAVSGINNTTQSRMRTLIARGQREGWSYDRLATEINDRFEGFGAIKPQGHIDTRAHLVAITEVGNAYEAGAFATINELKDVGLEMEKSWLTSGDGKVSKGCQENEAEGWIPADQDFRNNPSPHPLRFPGCRCRALYRRKGSEEEGDITVEPTPAPADLQPAARPRISAREARKLIKQQNKIIDDELAIVRARQAESENTLFRLHKDGVVTGSEFDLTVRELAALNERELDLILAREKEIRQILFVDNASTIGIDRITFRAGDPRLSRIEDALDFVQSMAADSVVGEGAGVTFRGTRARRASFSPGVNEISLNRGSNITTTVHELGHFLEETNPDLLQASVDFRTARAAGEAPITMNQAAGTRGYLRSEITTPDQFESPYIGKIYQTTGGADYATEISSMGLQYMYADPAHFAATDPEYFDFIYNALRGIYP